MAKRRELLKFAPALFLSGAAAAASIPSGIADEAKAKLTKEAFGDLKIFFEGSTDQIKSMTAGSLRLKAGMEPHPPHTHPEEEFMVITEGTGELYIAGTTSKVGPGSMMYCAGNKVHGIKNTGKTSLLFYFYKWKA